MRDLKIFARKGVSVLLCFILLGLTACGGNADTNQAEADVEAEPAVDDEADIGTKSDVDSDDRIEQLLDSMTLREKIGQMMFVSYRKWEEQPDGDDENAALTVENTESENPTVNVIELNDEIREDIKAYHFGGVMLFSENIAEAEQTLRLVADIQETNRAGGGLPMLVAADQEGGNVARIGFGTPGVGNMALAATGDTGNARRMAVIYGEEMSLLGINTDFAPVMDVNNNPNNPVIGTRSFSDDPETVAKYGCAFMEGLHETETIVTLKHFPGHGNTDTDSHTGFPCIMSSYEELKELELVPFQEAIDGGADMIMTAHIQYPNIETETYTSITTGEEVYLPATMSRTILTDILRDDMGFDGVIVTDALAMDAISENFSTEDVITLAINSGVNMLMPPMVMDAESYEQLHEMLDMAIELAEEGRLDPERIDDSVRRILKLKEKYGLLEQDDFSVTDEQISEAVSEIGSDEHREAAWDIAMQAITLVKNENEAFPIEAEENESALILFADSAASRVEAGSLAKQILEENGTLPDGFELSVMVNTEDNEAECVEAALDADYCILVHRMYDADNLNPELEDGLSSAVFDKIIEERHGAGKTVILVSCQLPYDTARFTDADAVLLTYNSSIMREIPPETGAGSGYMPNLPAALCACFGDGEPAGTLPVAIPRLDETYSFTDEVLYF